MFKLFADALGKSTTDCIFISNSLIQTVITVENKPLFCPFINLKKEPLAVCTAMAFGSNCYN